MSIFVHSPAIASSTELSSNSQTRWCRPVGPVDPMYIPGRSRTGSRPLRTVMSLALYATRVGTSRSRAGDRVRGSEGRPRKTAGQSSDSGVPPAYQRTPRNGAKRAEIRAAVGGSHARCATRTRIRAATTRPDEGVRRAPGCRPRGSAAGSPRACRRPRSTTVSSRTASRRACAATSTPTTSTHASVSVRSASVSGRPSSACTRASASAIDVGVGRVVRSRSFQTTVVDAQQLLGVQPGRDRAAVVTNVCPASRCASSAAARVVELAEHVVEEQHRRCAAARRCRGDGPARRSASARVRCSPCDACERLSSPSTRSRHSSRCGPASVTRRSSSARRRSRSAACSADSSSAVGVGEPADS